MNHRDTEAQRKVRNQLLRKANLQQQYEKLEQEAAEFFSTPSKADRAEAKAFQKASMKSMEHD
jgi:hypothetical protein